MFLFIWTLSLFLYFLRIYYNENSLLIEMTSPKLTQNRIMCHTDQFFFFLFSIFCTESCNVVNLTLSWRRSLSYRNRFILFDSDLRRERGNGFLKESSDDYNVNIAITQLKEKIKTNITAHLMLLSY